MKYEENKNTIHENQKPKSAEENIPFVKNNHRSDNPLYDLNANYSTTELFVYFLILSICFCGLTFLFFYLRLNGSQAQILAEDSHIIKSKVDNKTYRIVRLPNNMEITLISDSTSPKCAASLSIGLGSFNDDKNYLGIAHLLEHIIFSGSQSLNNKMHFEDHLSKFYGSTDSYTEEEKMTFFFNVHWQGFDKALEIFSRIINEPIVDEHDIPRLIDTIHEEFLFTKKSEHWKEHQILKEFANDDHPFSRFSIGNHHTLRSKEKEILATKLKIMIKKFFTPGNMKMAIYSNQGLDLTQKIIEKHFNDVRMHAYLLNKKDKYNEIPKLPIPFKDLGKIVWFRKESNENNLDFVFVLDEVLTKLHTKPTDYISYFLKYSGHGSLLEYLMRRTQAVRLNAGLIGSYKTFSLFGVSIYLTKKGLEEVNDVIQSTFDYISIIKDKKISKNIYEDIKNIAKSKFK